VTASIAVMEWGVINLNKVCLEFFESVLLRFFPKCLIYEIWLCTDWCELKQVSCDLFGIRYRHDIRWYVEYTIQQRENGSLRLDTNPDECTFYFLSPNQPYYDSITLWEKIGCVEGERQRICHAELFSQSTLGAFTARLQEYITLEYSVPEELKCLVKHLHVFCVSCIK